MFGISIAGGDELYYRCNQYASPKGCMKSKHQGICSVVLSQVELHSDGLLKHWATVTKLLDAKLL